MFSYLKGPPKACHNGVPEGYDMIDFLSVRMILQLSRSGAGSGTASGVVLADVGAAGFRGIAAEAGLFSALGFLGEASGLVSPEKSGSSSSGFCRHAGVCSMARHGFSLLLSGWRV